MTSFPTIRLLADPDIPTACVLAWDALQQVSVATGHRAVDYDDVTRGWLEGRARHLLAHDAPGCWVADEGGELLGVALSLRRDDFWFLSLLTVRIGRQGRGIGRLLLDAARGHAAGTTSGAIAASMDPKALRRYAAAGFDLLPCYEATGRPRTDPAAVVNAREAVRPGVLPADRPLLDAVDRAVRGATRGPDWNFLLPGMQLLVADGAPGERGYALVREVAVGAVVAETPAAGPGCCAPHSPGSRRPATTPRWSAGSTAASRGRSPSRTRPGCRWPPAGRCACGRPPAAAPRTCCTAPSADRPG
ncbi:MAG: family N-acetyltransferase [Mycobacterium sp.]|nr:family N-acetyltransferase [Mycobacterium sp.]